MKKIISVIVALTFVLALAIPFAAADAPTLTILSHNTNSVEYEYTGAGADSWVGVYAEGEVPSAETPAIMWKALTEGDGTGKVGLIGGASGTRNPDSYTNLPQGNYKLYFFPDGGYTIAAEASFEVAQYDVVKDDKYTYLSDLEPKSWVMYEASSEDEEPMYVPTYDIQENSFTGSMTLNVGGKYYEKGIRLHPGNDTVFNPLINNYDKYAEIVYDISSLDVNRFYTAAGKDSVGQKGWALNYVILADDIMIYCSGEIQRNNAAYIDITIPEGTKTLTLRGLSYDGFNDDSFAFCDAKVWKEESKSISITKATNAEFVVAVTGAEAGDKLAIGLIDGEEAPKELDLSAGNGEYTLNDTYEAEKTYTVQLISGDNVVDEKSYFLTQDDVVSDTDTSANETTSGADTTTAPTTTGANTGDNGSNSTTIIIIAVIAVVVIAVVVIVILKGKKSGKKA